MVVYRLLLDGEVVCEVFDAQDDDDALAKCSAKLNKELTFEDAAGPLYRLERVGDGETYRPPVEGQAVYEVGRR
jgi:hypothetical protein